MSQICHLHSWHFWRLVKGEPWIWASSRVLAIKAVWNAVWCWDWEECINPCIHKCLIVSLSLVISRLNQHLQEGAWLKHSRSYQFSRCSVLMCFDASDRCKSKQLDLPATLEYPENPTSLNLLQINYKNNNNNNNNQQYIYMYVCIYI